MSFNLTKGCKLTRVINATAAGTSDVNGSTIDMKGYDSVVFIVGFGEITATAVTSIKAQQGAASNMSDAADLLGTAISVADDDDDQIVALEVVKPQERYVRVVVDRGTANAVIDFGIALQHAAQTEPVTHDPTTVIGSECHHAPSEGTA
ncbi:MAG: hypothetical protein A2V70_11345 [Planctomycetes bacterium RBG_13_63_9]|nr:MAG: hypothetical protein A2V70_11345 [Planctomycetes bacterium RBG_13_63_9]